MAKELRRNSVGYELDLELEKVIQRKLRNARVKADRLEFTKRTDGKHLRTKLQTTINAQRTVTRKNKH